MTVEGHFVGRLDGPGLRAARGVSSLEDKALRAAAQRAVAPEVARRLGRMAAEPDEAFALTPDGAVLWRGEAAAALGQRARPSPRACGCSASSATARPASAPPGGWRPSWPPRPAGGCRRCAAWRRRWRPETLKGLPRGLAYRLIEAGGVLPAPG